MHKIVKLPDHIQKIICAGEVITSPYNILKELVENAIDARATAIRITLSKDNLNIEVNDNGIGICKEDFESLCKPHHTSKYTSDMNFNNYFGFRGEALASIKCVSHFVVKSKIKTCEVGYEKDFRNDTLVPIAMNNGTSVRVSNIFYNNKIREKCYNRNLNEHKKCYELIYSLVVKYLNIKFYINNEYIEIATMSNDTLHAYTNSSDMQRVQVKNDEYLKQGICVKFEQNVHTNSAMTVSKTEELEKVEKNEQRDMKTQMHNFRSQLEEAIKSFQFDNTSDCSVNTSEINDDFTNNMNKVYNKCRINTIEKLYKIHELKEYSNKVMTLLFTSSNMNYKTYKFLLFINNRLVYNHNLKEIIFRKYQPILPKNRYPFIYLDIIIPNENIDVNVHPSKKEVIFEHEELIIDLINKVLDNGLNESRQIANPIYKNPTSSSNLVYKDHSCIQKYKIPKIKTKYNLLSIKKMQAELVEVEKDFVKDLVYVGIFNKMLLVQYNQHLMKCDLQEFILILLRQYFVQNFGNIECTNVHIEIDHDVRYKEMLCEYFSIQIENKIITKIPVICQYHNDKVEEWNKLTINGDEEEVVFKEVIDFLVMTYCGLCIDKNAFAICKRIMKGTKKLLCNFTILKSLKELYKCFERC